MESADEQIRVSDRVKRQLDRHRREGESYNDVLERLLEENITSDFYRRGRPSASGLDPEAVHGGFGILSDGEADWIREQRAEAKQQRKERMQRLGESE